MTHLVETTMTHVWDYSHNDASNSTKRQHQVPPQLPPEKSFDIHPAQRERGAQYQRAVPTRKRRHDANQFTLEVGLPNPFAPSKPYRYTVPLRFVLSEEALLRSPRLKNICVACEVSCS